MTALLEVRGLTLGYGRSDAVRGLDLDVPEGSVVCLIGANGAGKTTTLHGLSGLIPTRAGTVRFAGRDVTGMAPHTLARAGIVQVPEGRQVFASLTVAENLAMGGYARPAREAKARLETALSLFPRLRERMEQRAGLLSGGEQQMLAIGRALMAEPRVLLLDEPSMGLAPLFVEEIFRTIRRLKAEGRTILLVEQNARAALDVSDTAYVLETGTVTVQGTAAEVAADPRVLAAYLGG